MAYSKTTNFGAKDTLESGDPDKIIYGSEFDTEFNNIETELTAVNAALSAVGPSAPPTGYVFTKYQPTWSETIDTPGTHLIVTHHNTFISAHSGTSGTVYSARYGVDGWIMTDPLFQAGGSAGYPTGNITRSIQFLVSTPNATKNLVVSWYYTYSNLQYTHGNSYWSAIPVTLESA